MSKPQTITLRINQVVGQYREGDEVKVRSKNGVPLDKFWRDRIKDSEYDNCVTVLKKKRQAPGSEQA